jgi:hypothetical protein
MMGWMAPLRHQCAKLVFSENHQEREPGLREQAGHMTASDFCLSRYTSSCQAGAIHT